MKIFWIILSIIVVIAVGLSIYLQPNSFALCPYNNGAPVTRDGCEAADAIIAVSGGDTTARTDKAIESYRHGWAPLLIFSGAAEDKAGPSNAMAMRQYAIAKGVPAEAILIEELSENTRQNAELTRNLLVSRNIKDVILITSGYHERRASLEFKARTKDDQIMIRTMPTYDRDWHWWWWVTPQGWYLAFSEFIRIITLYVQGAV